MSHPVPAQSSGPLSDAPDLAKILKIVHTALDAQKHKPEPKVKIILYNTKQCPDESGDDLTARPTKKRKRTSDEDEKEHISLPRPRTRSQQPDLKYLKRPKHYRRPKVYPSYTPWGYDWKSWYHNDLYPKEPPFFEWDNSDVPDFDLGEPLDEYNHWELPWIAANEEKKRLRDERERKRKNRQRHGGRKAAGRKQAYKTRAGLTPKRKKGKFVKMEA